MRDKTPWGSGAWLRTLALLVFVQACPADEADTDETDAAQTSGIFTQGRKAVGRQYMAAAKAIDNFFSGVPIEQGVNNSYLRLEWQGTAEEGGNTESDLRLKAKIDLPNTKKRFRFILDSDMVEEDPLEQRVRPVATGERIKKGDSAAGFEYGEVKGELEWESAFGLGVKLGSPLDPFARYRLSKKWLLPDQWSARFRQNVWFFHEEGWGESSRLRFVRPLAPNIDINVLTEAEFKDQDDRFEYLQSFSIVRKLSEDAAAEYGVGALGVSQPSQQVSSYFIGLNYRRRLYQDWLFVTVSPELFFPREEDWDATPSLTVKLEGFFTE